MDTTVLALHVIFSVKVSYVKNSSKKCLALCHFSRGSCPNLSPQGHHPLNRLTRTRSKIDISCVAFSLYVLPVDGKPAFPRSRHGCVVRHSNFAAQLARRTSDLSGTGQVLLLQAYIWSTMPGIVRPTFCAEST